MKLELGDLFVSRLLNDSIHLVLDTNSDRVIVMSISKKGFREMISTKTYPYYSPQFWTLI